MNATQAYLHSSEALPDWSQWPVPSPRITKIVIGKLDESLKGGALPEDFSERFPNLKLLHLWGLEGLSHLPELPAGLEELDVRKCRSLESLPELPKGLQVLDAGECGKLTQLPEIKLPSLREVFFNDCEQLDREELAVFFRLNRTSLLEWVDVSKCPGFVSLKNLPGSSLRKLVLRGCRNFEDASVLESFEALEHLDLRDCQALKELPALPDLVTYVLLHGCTNLRHFANQDISSYDCGEEDENVVENLRSRLKFGGELAVSAHAKLLFVGDGRVGKSTLSKRLIWDTLSPEERELRRDECEPKEQEDPTHKMRFWNWSFPLKIDTETLKKRIAGHQLEAELTKDEELPADLRVWDFGGQEIYHNTHRLFASEGSVFVIAWRPEEPDWDKIKKQKPESVTDLEWREWNRRRPLDYWLDYIASMEKGGRRISVAIVRTNVTSRSKRANWQDYAPRHKERELDYFEVDSLGEEVDCEGQPGYRDLVKWLKKTCGDEAARIGLFQPSFFAQVARGVDDMLVENDTRRGHQERPEHLLKEWSAWESEIKKRHEVDRQERLKKNPKGELLELEDRDVRVITSYLHHAGHIFHIKRGRKEAVLVAQEWGTGLIYEMLRPGGYLYEVIQGGSSATRGLVYKTSIERDPNWENLADEFQRSLLLDYMKECELLVLVADENETRLGDELYLANERWLLPSIDSSTDLREDLDKIVESLSGDHELDTREQFSFESVKLSEFEFRGVMAYLGRHFGTQAIWFREGMQAVDQTFPPTWSLRVKWKPENGDQDAFLGSLDATLWTRKELSDSYGEQLEEFFNQVDSPIAKIGSSTRKSLGRELDDAWGYFGLHAKPVVGVSSSGKNESEARELVAALNAAGLRTKWYLDRSCRQDEHAKVEVFMKEGLGKVPCVITLLSDDYLKNDPHGNWYCPWELADAINKWKSGFRTIAQTQVIYLPGHELDSKTFDDLIAPVFKEMRNSFSALFSSKDPEEQSQFEYYNLIRQHFNEAFQSVGDFFKERGTLGDYCRLGQRADGTMDYSEIIEAVKKALKERPRQDMPGE